jgi:hypothetical protein
MIAHLEVRTRSLRENFLQAGDYVIVRVLDFLSDKEAFAVYLEKSLRANPSMLREEFSKELTRRGLPLELLDTLITITTPIIPNMIEQQKSTFPAMAAQLRKLVPDALKQAAKTGHIRALKKSIAPEPKFDRYKALFYSIEAATDSPLILGDSIVVFSVEGEKPFKSYLDKDDFLNAVYLPLGLDKVLIGTRPGFDGGQNCLAEAIAGCSLEYFIASECSERNDSLKNRIGIDAGIITQEELETLVDDLISNY